ncbi:MAG: hypothetical protein IPP51_00675 [Bacteroidetes bacterium]|nr:hypothetical protein [Bacteroidota bacterium]
MEETYQFLIEFKSIHPFRFWTSIFIATSLIIFAIWKLSRKKRKVKIEHLENERASSGLIAQKETVKSKVETKKENPILKNRKLKLMPTRLLKTT